MYKAHTQFDFSGNQVSGKIRTPAVFYIFQRKRSEGHQVIVPPVNFNYHDTITEEKLKKYLSITERALKGIKIKKDISIENKKKAEDMLDMASRYFSDANFYYKEKNDYVTSFASVNYAHAWLDSCARLGFLDIDDDVREFFVVD